MKRSKEDKEREKQEPKKKEKLTAIFCPENYASLCAHTRTQNQTTCLTTIGLFPYATNTWCLLLFRSAMTLQITSFYIVV